MTCLVAKSASISFTRTLVRQIVPGKSHREFLSMATVTPSTTPSYCTLECPKSVELCCTHIGLKPAQAKYVMKAFKSKGRHEKSAIDFHGLQFHTSTS